MPVVSLILTSVFFTFPPSSHSPIVAECQFLITFPSLLSVPSHFIIMTISIFFYLFADDYECMLSGSLLTPKNVFERLFSYLNLQFDLVNWLCLSCADLFKFMRLNWGVVSIWSHLHTFLKMNFHLAGNNVGTSKKENACCVLRYLVGAPFPYFHISIGT